MQVPNFFNGVVAEPILSKEALESLFGFTDHVGQCVLIGTKYIEGFHSGLGPTDV
jgi:hypothetical protein